MRLITTKSDCKFTGVGVRIKTQREVTKRMNKNSVVKYAVMVRLPDRPGMVAAPGSYTAESFENDFSDN
jgi:biotin synthase-like enzyme